MECLKTRPDKINDSVPVVYYLMMDAAIFEWLNCTGEKGENIIKMKIV